MELTLQPLASVCDVTGRAFQEGNRVVSYLGREANGEIIRRDLLESEDGQMTQSTVIFCRWVTQFKPKPPEANPERALKLTAENLFLTLADPAAERSEANTPLLRFLTLMLERKKLVKPRGLTEDGARRIYEHMPSHQFYEVPAGTLDEAFFRRIREQLGVLVGEPKVKSAPVAAAPVSPA